MMYEKNALKLNGNSSLKRKFKIVENVNVNKNRKDQERQ